MKELVRLLVAAAVVSGSALAATVYIEGPNDMTGIPALAKYSGVRPPGEGWIYVRILVEDIPNFGGIQFALKFTDRATGEVSNAFAIKTDDRPWDAENPYPWGNDNRYELDVVIDDPETEQDESQPGLAIRHNRNKFGGSTMIVYVPTEVPMTTFGMMCGTDTDVTTKVWAMGLCYGYDITAPATFDITFDMAKSLVASGGTDITGTCTIVPGSVTFTPEPATIALLGAGLAGLAAHGRRRTRG